MNINTNRNIKKPTVLIFLALTLVIAVVFVLEKTRVTDFIKDPFYSEPSSGPSEEEIQQQNQTQAEQKSDFLDRESTEDNSEPAAIPTESDSIKLNPEQSGDTITVRNELHGQGYSSGFCKLNIQNGNSSVTQDAQIIYQPEYSMCAGFSVPVSSVGNGSWTIRLEVTPFGGETLTKTIAFEVGS